MLPRSRSNPLKNVSPAIPVVTGVDQVSFGLSEGIERGSQPLAPLSPYVPTLPSRLVSILKAFPVDSPALENPPISLSDSLSGFLNGSGSCNWFVVSAPPGINPSDVVISDPTDCGSPFFLPGYGDYVFGGGGSGGGGGGGGGGSGSSTTIRARSNFSSLGFCRSKSGTVELCGFDAFSDPTTPPTYYKSRVKAGTMTVCEGYDETCADPDCPGDYEQTGIVIPTGCGGLLMSGSLNFVGVDGFGNYLYSATCSATEVAPPHNSQGAQVWIACGNCITVKINNGETKSIGNDCTDCGCTVWSPFCSSNPQTPVKCIKVGLEAHSIIFDNWQSSDVYDGDCTLNSSSDTYRIVGSGYDCGTPSGSHGTLPCSDVVGCYGSGADYTSSSTQKTASGLGCVFNGVDYDKYSGEVSDTLSDPDTEEAAIARFDATHDFGGYMSISALGCPSYRETRTGKGFAYGLSQWKVTASNLDPAGSYQAQAMIYQRPYGSGGSYTYAGTATAGLTPDMDGNASTSDHQISPSDGVETVALYTNVIRLS